MSTVASNRQDARYHGLHMAAAEYFRLEDDGCRYELIDGVVCVSPSPTFWHQKIALHIGHQISAYLEGHPVGEVACAVDVHLGRSAGGGDLVYRPDVVFLSTRRAAECGERIVGLPDVVVEIVFPGSRHQDTIRKRFDYERCGVPEYWIIDPERHSTTFYRLQGAGYIEIEPSADGFVSTAIPGFPRLVPLAPLLSAGSRRPVVRDDCPFLSGGPVRALAFRRPLRCLVTVDGRRYTARQQEV